MKHINRLIAFAALGTGMCLTACQDVELSDPNITTTASDSYANFAMVNASPDAAALDLFVNNVWTGTTVEAGTVVTTPPYTNVNIPSNGVLANTAVRAKATTGTIGGALGSNALIFRAGNNNANNFTAADSAYYTFIVLDSITRPKPLRTVNALGIGDTTYFNRLTGTYISGVERAPMPAAQKSKTVAIGTVPLGSTDPGGVRYLILTDQLPLPSTTRFPKPATGKFAIRFVHATPDLTGSLTITVGPTALTAGITAYPLSFPTFTPSVGSRSTTASFANNFANAGALDIVVKSGATEIARLNAQNFSDKGVYTIVMSGKRSSLPLKLTVIKNK